jgi:hypothetical protein
VLVIVAVLLIGLFVAIVGSLMFVGWRYRPELELPPRFPDPVEPPPAYRRWRRRLFAVRITVWLVGWAGYVGLRSAGLRLAATAFGVVAIVVYLCSLFAPIGMSLAHSRRNRKERGLADERRDRGLQVP